MVLIEQQDDKLLPALLHLNQQQFELTMAAAS